jgi:hypothetical protein
MNKEDAKDLEKFLVYLRDDVLSNHAEMKAVINIHLPKVHEDTTEPGLVTDVKVERVSRDKRSEERDPGESEQREAEKSFFGRKNK